MVSSAANKSAATTTSNVADDDEDVLDISEQTNRPVDDALHQQRIQAWHPILHPVWVIIALFCLGIILVPVGFKLDSMQDEVVELKVTYDQYNESGFYDADAQICGIGENYSAGRKCTVELEVPQNLEPPILIYYELTNFHQNHRSYVNSRDDFQLAGEVGSQDKVSRDRCEPLNELGNITLNPCGMIANTFFNDIFTLKSPDNYTMREDGIAWESDLKWLFHQPNGFFSQVCPGSYTTKASCEESECCQGTANAAGEAWSCNKTGFGPFWNSADETCYRYYYPNDDTTQYLYETYPNIISPLEGVTNEHFVVWMRVALQPTFRKLYGWIDTPVDKGVVLRFEIEANYVVTRFKGSKSLILTTNNMFGGRNIYLGPMFYWVGIFCFAAGVFFTAKHVIKPRKLADRSYLHFKVD